MADQTPQNNDVQPVQPEPAVQPVQPEQPVQPVQPEQPVQPVQPEPAVQAQVTGQPIEPPQPQQAAQAAYAPPQSPYATGAPVSPSSAAPGAKPAGESKGTTSLVMGILSIVFNAPPIGLVLGIIAIVFGRQAKRLTPEGTPNSRATGGIITGIIGVVLSVICTISVIVILLSGALFLSDPDVQKSLSEMDSSSYSSLSSSSSSQTPDEATIRKAAETALDKACNPDDATIAELSSEVETAFIGSAGFSLSELGVSSDELAEWIMSGASYKIKDLYAYSNTSMVSATVTVRDSQEFLSIWEESLSAWQQTSEFKSLTDPEAIKTKSGALMREAMEKTPMVDTFVYVDVTKENGTWSVSAEEQKYLLTQMYSL